MLLCPYYDFSGGQITEKPEVEPYKIGIMTGTVSQGEEEYQEAINQMPNMVTSSFMPPTLTNSPQKWKRPSLEPLKWHRILSRQGDCLRTGCTWRCCRD
jgi:hypothetical protein